MSVYLTSGHELSGQNYVHEMLTCAGLMTPIPTQPDRWCPEIMASKILSANLKEEDRPRSFQQIKPGKAWETVAANIILANIEQDFWGWQSTQSVPLLNFWKNYDADINFILVYSKPETNIARYILSGKDASQTSLAIDEWKACNNQLLSFYLQNKDRCILVNEEKAKNSKFEFLQLISKKFMSKTELSLDGEHEFKNIDATAAVLASLSLQDRDDIISLYLDLESAADMPAEQTVQFSSKDDIEQAIHQFQITHIASLKSLETNRTSDNQAPLHDLEKATASLEIDQDQPENNAILDELEEVRQENELLTLQLHQVQEELEYYFQNNQELLKATSAQPTIEKSIHTAEPDTHEIDMRHFIDGENWHHPEHNGRWSGPGTTSRIKLPHLAKGHYTLELHLEAAMARDTVRKTKLIWQGQELKFKSHQPWRGFKPLLRRYYLLMFQNREGGPLIIRAPLEVNVGSTDYNQFLKIVGPRTISPQSRGLNDSRDLGLMLSKLSITPNTQMPD